MRSLSPMSILLLILLLADATPLAAQVAPASASANGLALSTETIAARAVPATVTIVTFGDAGDTLGMGSGFLVRATGVVVTNFHVMAGATRAAVILTSGERYDRVEALDQDEGADLALLKIPGYGLPVLPTTAVLPPVGAKLVAVGNPLGLSRTVSEGIVSAVRLVDGRQLVQMSAAISPGSSGGPVLNAQGEVVAIATSYLKQGQNLNFAVPVRYAMGLVDAARAPVSLAQAFRAAGHDEETPARVRAAAPEAGLRETRPARSTHPRSSILGTWDLAERVSRADGAVVDFTGVLFLGENDLGFSAMLADGSKTGRVLVFPIQSHTATRDGRVSIKAGSTVLDGYQTDLGLFLEGEATGDKGALRMVAVATPGELALSTPTGLYDIDGQTTMYYEGKVAPDLVHWTGETAVVVANDSVYVDLFMTNDSGGTTSATGIGALRVNRFEITTASKEHLLGTLSDGRLWIEWTDHREWGRYEGRLTGRRK